MFELALIPARGGSKRLPGKNVRMLNGRPMIAWTVEAALTSGCFKRTVVTTDDEDIAAAAVEAGAEVPFMRPTSLSGDTSTSMDVVLHALEKLGTPSSFALLQPTSPLRSAEHIREAAQLFSRKDAEALISISRTKPISWHFELSEDRRLRKILSGDVDSHWMEPKTTCSPNGAIYIYQTNAFLEHEEFIPSGCVGYEMSAIDSLDVDLLEDFQLVEAIIEKGLRGLEPASNGSLL